MAGLDPAIHVFLFLTVRCAREMPGSSPGMTMWGAESPDHGAVHRARGLRDDCAMPQSHSRARIRATQRERVMASKMDGCARLLVSRAGPCYRARASIYRAHVPPDVRDISHLSRLIPAHPGNLKVVLSHRAGERVREARVRLLISRPRPCLRARPSGRGRLGLRLSGRPRRGCRWAGRRRSGSDPGGRPRRRWWRPSRPAARCDPPASIQAP